LLARERLYGIKIGSVWAMYAADVEAFERMRRPPGRPRKLSVSPANTESAAEAASEIAERAEGALLIKDERASAGTHRLLRKRGRKRK
jgi:hypothetical protein